MSSPRISDNLIKDSNGNNMLSASASASAVNFINVWNRATGGAPVVEAIGADADVSLNLRGKGNGVVQINGGQAISRGSLPATATSTGVVGQVAFDSTWFYVCVSTNTWRRAALSTW